MLLSVAWESGLWDVGIGISLKSGLPKKKKNLKRNTIGTIWDVSWGCKEKCEQRKAGSKPTLRQIKKRSGEVTHKERILYNAGALSVTLGVEEVCKVFFRFLCCPAKCCQWALPRPGHSWASSQISVLRGRKKDSSMTKWPLCFAMEAVYFCIRFIWNYFRTLQISK